MTRLRDQRGISTVVVSVSLVALFGAAMLAIDAGSAWATRRKIVTGTDAAALAAARYFSNNLSQACLNGDGTWNGIQVPGGNAEAAIVLSANSSKAEHNAADGFLLTVSGCSTGYPVGRVRFDGRLGSQQSFSSLFGFGKVKPFSSSTAEFGYLTSPVGLRPIAICDQSSVVWPAGQPVIPPAVPPGPSSVTPSGFYPHFALWNWYQKGKYEGFGGPQYNRYFGSLASEYPSVSLDSPSKNGGHPYLSPDNGGGVVHRVNARDSCGGGAEWRGWVNLNGGAGGTGNGKCDDNKDPQTLECMLVNGYDGYPGPVSVGDPATTPPTPRECNNSPSEWCAENTGNHDGIKDSLDRVTCDYNVRSSDCPLVFPIILTDGVVQVAGKDEVHQVAFVYVILRGWGGDSGDNNPCSGKNGHACYFDLEFVKVQGTGSVGHNPSPNDTSPQVTDLCGIDHDSLDHRCNV